MDAARFAVVEEVFHRASQVAGDERARALAEGCGDDRELRREVEELLAAADRESPVFDRPALAVLAEAAPERIGPYRVLRRLGQGGSSVVYLCEEEGDSFRRLVAVKLLAGFAAEHLLRRFAAETRILAGLEHPGIARFYAAGRNEDGAAYLALEYVEGTDLVTYCRERRASLAERLRLFADVLDAVDYAHRSLVVHRDIKPSNLQVSLDGRPKLLDFGIAALLDPADGVAIGETATLLRALTPAYASPEQIRGERVTTASDVYSLGVVLYELLAGVLPHSAAGLKDELLRGFREHEPEAPSAAARHRGEAVDASLDWRRLRGDLDVIVGKALRRDPAARYASVSALADDLRRFAAGLPVLARSHTLRYRAGRFLRRRAAPVATAAAVVLLAAGGLAWHWNRLQEERDRAHAAAEEARREARRAERVAELLAAVFEAANPMDQPGRPLTGKELLERGGERVERGLDDEPELRAQMQAVLGGIWTSLGEYDRAAALLEPAVAALERHLGPEHTSTAKAWVALGNLRQRHARYDEARALYEKALAVHRKNLGPRDSIVAAALNNYGNTLKMLGDFPGAKAALEESLAIYSETEGPESAQAGRSLANLSLVLERLEDFDGSARAIERAIVILAKAYGTESPRYALNLNMLANVRFRQERYREAASLAEEVLRINEAALGKTYPGESGYRNFLAWAHFKLGRLDEARSEFERAVAAAAREKGPDHADAAWPLRGLAEVEMSQGRFAEAERALQRAHTLRLAAYGPAHWEVAQSFTDLAGVAQRRGDARAEESRLREALAVSRQAYKPDHPELARSVSRLGEALCRKTKSTEGAALLAEAIGLREKAGNPKDEELAEWRTLRDGCSAKP